MQAAIQIPAPTESDSETVATALETAAIFSAKGDTAEAIRWLQRAAESAGDAGDDVRTLNLARTAADLTRSMQEAKRASEAAPPSEPESATPRRLPKPPLRQTPTVPAADDTETPLALSQRPEPPRTVAPSPAQPASTRPPPPSTRSVTPAPTRPSAVVSGTAGTASVAPRHRSFGPRSALPGERPVASSSTPTPGSVSARGGLKPSWRLSAQSGVETPLAEAGAAEAVEPTSVRPRPSERGASRVGAGAARALAERPAAESSTPPVEGVAARASEQQKPARRLRSAARVSVIASSTEPGLYFVRVLDDEAPAPSDSTEALLVVLDPGSALFSG